MKRPPKPNGHRRVLKNYKLPPLLVRQLKRHARRLRITQTQVVEEALIAKLACRG